MALIMAAPTLRSLAEAMFKLLEPKLPLLTAVRLIKSVFVINPVPNHNTILEKLCFGGLVRCASASTSYIHVGLLLMAIVALL